MLLGDASGRVPKPYYEDFFKSNRDGSIRDPTSITPIRHPVVSISRSRHGASRRPVRGLGAVGGQGEGLPFIPGLQP